MLTMLFVSCSKGDDMVKSSPVFSCKNIVIDGRYGAHIAGVPLKPIITATFDDKVNIGTLKTAISVSGPAQKPIELIFTPTNQDSTVQIQLVDALNSITNYVFSINTSLKSADNRSLSGDYTIQFTTIIDTLDKRPRISDDQLMDTIQRQTFSYFWEFAHPVSGMIRERNTSGDLVTTGGTGFGIMAIVAAVHRGFISREDGLNRIITIADFLEQKTTRYHGAFAHWIDGATGATIPFSSKDDGGDLVETSFLIAGLLCAAEYFDRSETTEQHLRETVQRLWHDVEWDWYTNGKNVLYWHWSPKYNWEINLPIKGWNEALITYILAAASPTHGIQPEVYHQGWASGGQMKNGNSYYNYTLPLGPALGGPLFFEHYSFLGINPMKLQDQYADYRLQTVNHTLINRGYCIRNPQNYYGYSDKCWGLTASDTRNGYTAHSPTNDKAVITPSAALSSLPFTPDESLKAMRFFYYKLGDFIFGKYGFYDAFSLHYGWKSNTWLAIDQGPIMIMIENYRSGLIWEYTMRNKDIRNGLDKLGFTY
ncbi:MAG: Ig-like domain-containing protein [Saprospiraceae bacterium]|nr:Ig-like domain-containing protein [Saprospiraceae bacterium]